MTTAETARMPFGKYKNISIEKIDPSYLGRIDPERPKRIGLMKN
jgi:hypothetical protein